MYDVNGGDGRASLQVCDGYLYQHWPLRYLAKTNGTVLTELLWDRGNGAVYQRTVAEAQ